MHGHNAAAAILNSTNLNPALHVCCVISIKYDDDYDDGDDDDDDENCASL